jgi:RNA polymerase sigma-70 factor (ECF subfamily)
LAVERISRERYAELVQDGKARYYRTAYCYVKNEHDALDIIGEATLRGLKSLGSLENPEYFDTWMTRIVINAAIDHIRRSSRRQESGYDALEGFAADEGALDADTSLDLYAALDVLNDRDKSCVILRFFQERTFAEISRILGEPEPTIKSRLYRSLAKMRAHMEGGAAR